MSKEFWVQKNKITPPNPLVWPLLIALTTLTYAALRDSDALYTRVVALREQTLSTQQPLERAIKEAAFIDSIRADLQDLSRSDPVAAKILNDFYPPPPKPTPMPTTAPKPKAASAAPTPVPTPTPTP